MLVSLARSILFPAIRYTLFGLLVLSALYVSIGRIVIGASPWFRDDVERFLQVSIGTEVRIGSLEGDWQYFDPIVHLNHLVVGPVESPVLVIENLTLRVGSLYTVWERSPVLTEIMVDGVELTLEQDEGGRWHLAGFPDTGRPARLDVVYDSVAHLEEATARNLRIHLQAIGSEYLVKDGEAGLRIVRDGKRRLLSLPLQIENGESGHAPSARTLVVMGEYTGNPGVRKSFSASLYTRAGSIELAHFIPAVTVKDFRLVSAIAGSQLWIDFEGADFDIRGTFRTDEIALESDAGRFDLFNRLDVGFEATGRLSGDSLQIQVPELTTEVMGQHFSVSGASFVLEGKDSGYIMGGYLPEMDIASLAALVTKVDERLDIIPERGKKALAAMQPRGLLRELALYLDFSGARPDFRLTGNVRGAAVNAYLGAPSISVLDGFVSLGRESGYIDIDNGSYEMHFASMFRKPWPFESARGRVNYRLQDGELQVYSGLIELIRGELSAYGKLHANLPPRREDQTWGLIIGIRHADLLDANRYLPKTLSPTFLDWLNKSVLGGESTESALVFHGSLFRGAPKIRKAYELYFKVADSALDYDDRWPPVSDLAATIYINNRGVFSDDATGTVLGSRILRSSVQVPVSKRGRLDTVVIDGDLAGSFENGLRVLTETPLAETTAHMAETWTGTGDITARAHLEIPIGPRAVEETYVDVSVFMNDNFLDMPPYDLEVSSLDGTVRYESRTGLSAPVFTASLFDEPVKGFIESSVEGESGEIRVHMGGQVSMDDLFEWSDQILLTRTRGKMPYDAVLHVPYGGPSDRVYVEMESNLDGVVIDMPEPLKKEDPDAHRRFSYRQSFLDDGFRIDFSMEDQVTGALQIKDGIVRGGLLRFGEGIPGAVTYDRIRVTGKIEAIRYEEWDALFDSLDQASDVSLESALAETLNDIVLDVGLLDIYSLELPDTRMRITREENGWLATLENRNLAGTVLVPSSEDQPLDIDLAYLRFFEDEPDAEGDPFGDVAPQEIERLDFSTRELVIDGENYGSWKFSFRPDQDGAVLSNITAKVKGLTIEAPSVAYWRYSDGVHKSSFRGTVLTEDMGAALEQWGYASSIKGRDFRFVADFEWDGSPVMIDLDIIRGNLEIKGGKGRIVQADTGPAALKLLGIFDFNQLARRFRLDFSDVVDKGYEFNKVKGTASLDKGVVEVVDSIKIEGPGSNFKVGGKVDLESGEIDGDIIVTLPVGKNLPWYAAYSAIVTGPLTGAGVFLAQKVFGDQIDQMSSAKYVISGTIDEPVIEFDSIFNDTVRETSVAEQTQGE